MAAALGKRRGIAASSVEALPRRPNLSECAIASLARLSDGAMARVTGLEPATPGVTGRYSNRLNYRCASVEAFYSFLPAFARLSEVVGDDGIEPPTFCL